VPGVSLVLQVHPSHLPRLQEAMSQRVMASFGVSEVPPGSASLVVCALAACSCSFQCRLHLCWEPCRTPFVASGSILRQAPTHHGWIARRTRYVCVRVFLGVACVTSSHTHTFLRPEIPYYCHELKPGQIWMSRGDAVHCFAHLGPAAGSESLGVAINFVGTTWLLVQTG
jgi:hypothetical protein